MKHLKVAGWRLALYLDDLLLLAGSACFMRTTWELGGRPAALLVASGCLVAYIVIIARARRGRRR